VNLLLRYGADVNARDNASETPLHCSAAVYYTHDTEILVAHGAEINARNKQGATPLHLAAETGSKRKVELLLAHGAHANAKDSDGLTPLHYVKGMMGQVWGRDVGVDYEGVVALLFPKTAGVHSVGPLPSRQELTERLAQAVREVDAFSVGRLLAAGAAPEFAAVKEWVKICSDVLEKRNRLIEERMLPARDDPNFYKAAIFTTGGERQTIHEGDQAENIIVLLINYGESSRRQP
jgi:hypothetical protein